jgi:negative regulator of sigma E activity
MSSFEDDLKKALARVEPPEGFTERLAARIAALPRRNRPTLYWRWAAIAATVTVLFSSLAYQHQRQVQGEAAKEKLLVALRITSSKLQHTQQRIEEIERNQ